ncbi:coiled-coil domain-containing protein 39 isoform X2 [Cyprinodon tularosa]|uniref:coiled-coil domain-containing protein 39 isoform X2 n=1 Tax=Cyprinodon tularosa TaxID=77115 RepID=UPI0018E1E811|nr:coiled-coil domain-containing protein 39 isoform X2 [Cyprinodon tularosa]
MAAFHLPGIEDTELELLLSEIGWDPRYASPALDPYTKDLMETVHEAQMKLLHQHNSKKETVELQEQTTEKLKRMKVQLADTEALIKANTQEMEVGKHLSALTERESCRFAQLTAQTETELRSTDERIDILEKDLFKQQQKLEELRLQMDWDQQQMDNFLKESAEKDDDLMTIIKYSQQDEHRIKELTLALEKKSLEANEKRKALDKELTETRSAELALAKTLENIEQTRSEIQQLFNQCENTIKQKKQLDSNMQQCALHLAQGKQQIWERNASITELKHRLDTEMKNNEELQRNIAAKKRQGVILQQQLKEQEDDIGRMQDELKSSKVMLDGNLSDVRFMKSQISRMKKDIARNDEKIKEGEVYNAALEEKLGSVIQTALNEEERAAQMEQMIKETDQAIKLEVQQNYLMEELFRQKHQFKLLKEKEKSLTTQISTKKFTTSSLQKELNKLEKQQTDQQMIMNKQVVKIHWLQLQLAKLKGDVHEDEKEVLETRLGELNKTLEEKKSTAKSLKSALGDCEANIHFMRKEMEKSEALKRDLSDRVQEKDQVSEYLKKELKKLQLKNMDVKVENNVLRREVKRVRDLVYVEAESMLSLEMRKLELEKVMQEREQEIKVYTGMLRQQLKITEKDRQHLSMELNEKLSKIDKMKKRFEAMEKNMTGPEEKYQTCITKAVLEKMELQQKTDEIDAQVRKMELETKALQNTVQLFTDGSSFFHSLLNKATKCCPEYQENEKQQEEMKATEEKLKLKKQEVCSLREEIQDMNNTWESLLKDETVEKHQILDKKTLIAKREKEAGSIQERIGRATKKFTKLTKDIRSARNTKNETLEEQDLKLRELNEFNNTIRKMVNKAIEEDPELRPVLEQHFKQASLPFPSPSSVLGSQRSSKRSSPRIPSSLRSPESAAGSGSEPCAAPCPCVTTLSLDLDLSGASAPRTPPKCPASASSEGSSRSRKK